MRLLQTRSEFETNTSTVRRTLFQLLIACFSVLLIAAVVFLLVRVIRAEDILRPAPDGSFCIVALPDSQTYLENEPEVFGKQIDWILNNRDIQKIVFVTHVGDIVNRNIRSQWQTARSIMDRLLGQIPYGFSVGNHDMTEESGDCSLFQEMFPQSRFEKFSWYGSGLKNNADSFQLISSAGISFIVLHLECNAPDNVLAWADEVLHKHADRRAIVVTHMFVGPLTKSKYSTQPVPIGLMQWKKCHGDRGNTPEQMWQKCFRKHKNLFLVLCGDQNKIETANVVKTGDHGNRVHALLSDYREGYLRICRFVPSEDKIEVRTYSPLLGKLCRRTSTVSDREEHQFAISYRMTRK